MARLLALTSFVAAAAATNHAGESPGLPFVLGYGSHKGLGADINIGHGGKDKGFGGHNDGFLNGGQHGGIIGGEGKGEYKIGGNGHKGQSVNVIIITTNVGGGAKQDVWNEAPMQRGKEHFITVGGDAGLIFEPDTINAAVGDMVIFNFMSQNHTVTQSTFTEPCSRMAAGIDSGFMPNPNNSVNPAPTMEFQVTMQEPVWMFCSQGKHCEQGMVFSINPTAEKSHAQFKELAMAGEGGGVSVSAGVGASAVPPSLPAETGIASPPIVSISESISASIPLATLATGNGQMGSGDACSCSCLCGMASWPEGVGLEAQGGIPGTIPMERTAAKRSPRAPYY
ncbi:hypothetical protein PAAG_04376 [Paracoccidioides lutzii Pb01]|uniref:Phytocyanin domain-containing protein n=1 Tax=Paracoccidioides lutzii (strain ATCC MYA-826 / Pb01) TaxID=502779 RepID=C1H0T2_PARBA|nr:hypothetical protein PAAG_04376 [Paracoccidioides lutzii Pb01]EEH33326.1 hypothetical protein PAAG_04376 [Paracoccidioides lutzii Pb01]